ncbi:DUF4493 domain-containing protein [Sediminitomix flava]|uniref:Uncharacterized protein DUF4493 n=1 Tax=Sediminitomix flava TaxID=379075 RepID=A0A315Z5K4_SEDFL|nr:DUF4493 domain-containing protein [Sediminitomix flava]PWJ39183.1 uncharacterized protein DUF4493 [Sediminitomix flava]
MKQTFYKWLTIVCIAFLITNVSCQNEEVIDQYLSGDITLNLKMGNENKITQSRLSSEVSTDDFSILINLVGSEDTTAFYPRYVDMPSSITLRQGGYILSAYSGTEQSASFENPVYYGETEFEVTASNETAVSVECLLSNAKVRVSFTEDAITRYPDIYATINHGIDTLIYTQGENQAGYFGLSDNDSIYLDMTIYYTENDVLETYEKSYEGVKANDFYSITINASLDGQASVGVSIGDENVIEDEIILGEETEILTWSNYFGDIDKDEEVFSLIESINGGYILAGYKQGDAWLFKLDEKGELLWEQEQLSGDEIRGIAEDDLGNILIVGVTSTLGNGEDDILFAKLDHDGNIVWEKTFGGDYNDIAFSIEKSKDDNYFIVGSKEVEHNEYDLWVMKIDSEGNLIWEYTSSILGGFTGAQSISENTEYDLFISGYTNKNNLVISKLNSDGVLIWEKVFNDTVFFSNPGGMTHKASLIVSSEGYIYWVGNKWSNNNIDFWLLKLDSSNNVLWETSIGGGGSDYGNSVTEDVDGSLLLVGRTYSKGAGSTDAWVIKVDTEGNLLWDITYGNTSLDAANDVIKSKGGEIVTVGYTRVPDTGDNQAWVLKLNESGEL